MAGFRKILGLSPDLDRVQQNVEAAFSALPAAASFNAAKVSQDYAATGSEGVIHVDAGRGNVRITLPAPSPSNPPLTIQQVNSSGKFGTVSVVAAKGSKTISGANSIALDKSGTGSVTLSSDGSSWWPQAGGALVPGSSTTVVSRSTSTAPGILTTIGPLAGGGPMSSNLTLTIQPATESQAGSMSAGDKIIIDNLSANFVPLGRQILTTFPLVGGGDLTVDRTLALQGGIVSGDTSTAPQNLGSLVSGLLWSDVSSGIATIREAVAGTDYADPAATYLVASNSHLPTNGVNLGALASGVLQQSVSGGVSTPSVFASTAKQITYGAASGGGLRSTANFLYDESVGNLYLNTTGPWGGGWSQIQLHQTSNTPAYFVVSNSNTGSSAAAGFVMSLEPSLASQPYAAFSLYSAAFPGLGHACLFEMGQSAAAMIFSNLAGSGVQFSTGGARTSRMFIDSSGNVSIANLTAGGIVKATASTGVLGLATVQPSGGSGGGDVQGPGAYITGLTGDVTAAGPGSVAATIAANAVTFAKFQQVAGLSVVGVSGSSTANVAAITATANNQVLQEIGGALAFHTLDYSQLTGTPTSLPPSGAAGGDLTGTYPNPTVGAHKVTYAKMQQASASTLLGNPNGSTADVQEITLGNGLGFNFPGPGVFQVENTSALFSLSAAPPLSFDGTSALSLNIDSTLAVVSSNLGRAALTGDVTASAGSNATTIAGHAVSYAKMQQASTVTLLGNPTGGTANVSEITLGAGLAFSGTTLTATGNGKVLVDGSDTTADYLNAKIVVTAPITKSIFVPSPPSSGLKAWFKADAGVTTSGSNVTAWADQSGLGNNLTVGAASPVLATNILNGLPGINYTGSTQELVNTSVNLLTSGSARTVVAVVKSTTTTGGAVMSFRLGTPEWAALFTQISGTTYAYSDGVAVSASFTSPPTINGVPYAIEWACAGSGSNVAVALNGTGQTLATPTTTSETSTTGFIVGNRRGAGAGQYFQGYIFELLVYDHVLSAPDLAAIRSYLQIRYGITIAGAGGATEALNIGFDTTSLFYQTVKANGVGVTQAPILNFGPEFAVSTTAGVTTCDIAAIGTAGSYGGSGKFIQALDTNTIGQVTAVTDASLGPFTGDVTTPSAGSFVTKVVAVHETSGPTQLTFAAIPTTGDVLVRAGTTIAGVDPHALSTSTKTMFTYQFNQAASSTQWFGPDGVGPTVGAVEYPNDFLAGHVQIIMNVQSNTITGGALTIAITRNGTSIFTTALTSGTSTGVVVLSVATTGSASANDTYGLKATTNSGFTSGFNILTFQMLLTP